MIQHRTVYDETYLSGSNKVMPRISNLSERPGKPSLDHIKQTIANKSVLNTFTTTTLDNQQPLMELTESQFITRLNAPVHDQDGNSTNRAEEVKKANMMVDSVMSRNTNSFNQKNISQNNRNIIENINLEETKHQQ